MVEAPQALLGSFDQSHLQLPREVLISVMKKHQRYFPVFRDAGQAESPALSPHFIAVRNGDGFGLETVIDGNQHVIRARFADAAYFVREDIKKPLAAYLPRLKTLTFQVKLGSTWDETQRIRALCEGLAPTLNLDNAQTQAALRAAELCKADLATYTVVEMTSLQGTMGEVLCAPLWRASAGRPGHLRALRAALLWGRCSCFVYWPAGWPG